MCTATTGTGGLDKHEFGQQFISVLSHNSVLFCVPHQMQRTTALRCSRLIRPAQRQNSQRISYRHVRYTSSTTNQPLPLAFAFDIVCSLSVCERFGTCILMSYNGTCRMEFFYVVQTSFRPQNALSACWMAITLSESKCNEVTKIKRLT